MDGRTIDGIPATINVAVERALIAATDLLDADWATVLIFEESSQPGSTATVLRAARSDANHQLELYQRLVLPSPPLSWIASHGAVFSDDTPGRALLPAALRLPVVLASLVVALPPRGDDPGAADIAGSGALLIERIDDRPFLAGDVDRAKRIAARLVTVVDRATRRRRVLDDLAETTGRMSAALGVQDVLRALLAGSLNLCDWAGLRLEPDAPGAALTFLSAVRLASGRIDWSDEPFETIDPKDRVLVAGSGVALVDLEETAVHLFARYGFRQGLIVPMRTRSRDVGVLTVASLQGDAFNDQEIAVLQLLADHAGCLVEQALNETQTAQETERTRPRLLADQAGAAAATTPRFEATRAARDRLSTALEASGTMVVTLSLEGVIASVHGNATALLGLTASEIVGRSLVDFLPIDERRLTRDRLEKRTHGDIAQRRFETRVLHRDGHFVPVLIVTGPQFEGRRRIGHAVAMTDLTGLMSLQRERTAALAARSLAEGAVLTGRAIAHRLGSPVSSILVLAELMVGDLRLPPQSKADMQLLFDEAVRAAALLHRFSRITRYEEIDTPAGPQLDVERSSRDEEPSGSVG